MTIAFPIDRVRPTTTESAVAEVLRFPGPLTEDEIAERAGELRHRISRIADRAPELLIDTEAALAAVLSPDPRAA